ncbi:hypothetical protein CPB86DRAFT_779739 [Serendipita vermifera]|nr:hypothetical protein CPB86DRAFT_779739 [Serendipita vermifera]
MSVNASTLAKKEHYYGLLTQSIDELAQATSKYQGLMDKLVQQHKAMSGMTVWHSAQFMAVSKLVDIEAERVQQENESAENTSS